MTVWRQIFQCNELLRSTLFLFVCSTFLHYFDRMLIFYQRDISQDITRDKIFGYRYMVNISWIVLIVTLHFPYIWITLYWRQIEIWAPYDLTSILACKACNLERRDWIRISGWLRLTVEGGESWNSNWKYFAQPLNIMARPWKSSHCNQKEDLVWSFQVFSSTQSTHKLGQTMFLKLQN